VIDDVREKRGGDHGREEQPQRTTYGETPSHSKDGSHDNVGDGRDGVTML